MNKDFIKLVELVEAMQIDIAYDYDSYVRMAFAIANMAGEEGRPLFMRLCQLSDKYDENDANDLYTNALKTQRGEVGIGTVFHLAEAAGVDIRGLKYPKEEGHPTYRDNAGTDNAKDKGRDKLPWATPDDVKNFLDKDCFRDNEIIDKLEYRKDVNSEWKWYDEKTANKLWCEFNSKFRCDFSMFDRTVNSGFAKPYNPFKEYFYNLPKWTPDKPDYILELSMRIKLVDETPKLRDYFNRIFKKWLLNVVVGALRDDYVNQYILDLIGKQGIFKTSFFTNLMPKVLMSHVTSQNIKERSNRDEDIKMVINILILIEEIDHISPVARDKLKHDTAERYIQTRLPYEKYVKNMIRHNSFCATGNNAKILNDPTGYRRFLVFNVESIVSPYEHPINHEGIYSQAMALIQESEENYLFTTKDEAEINEADKDFEAPNIEKEMISKIYCQPQNGMTGKYVGTADILSRINVGFKKPLNASKIGQCMAQLGFIKEKKNSGMRYYVHEFTPAEIAANEAAEVAIAKQEGRIPNEQPNQVPTAEDLPF